MGVSSDPVIRANNVTGPLPAAIDGADESGVARGRGNRRHVVQVSGEYSKHGADWLGGRPGSIRERERTGYGEGRLADGSFQPFDNCSPCVIAQPGRLAKGDGKRLDMAIESRDIDRSASIPQLFERSVRLHGNVGRAIDGDWKMKTA